MAEDPWLKRSWVVQEVGLSRRPSIVLYGEKRFSYRIVMKAKRVAFKYSRGFYTLPVHSLAMHRDWEVWGTREGSALDTAYEEDEQEYDEEEYDSKDYDSANYSYDSEDYSDSEDDGRISETDREGGTRQQEVSKGKAKRKKDGGEGEDGGGKLLGTEGLKGAIDLVWANQRDEDVESYTFLGLLDQASVLECKDNHDKVYTILGHPLAQKPGGLGPVIVPDYRKRVQEVYKETSLYLLETSGLRLLGSCQHTKESIADLGFPSWMVRWNIVEVANNISQLVDVPPRPPREESKAVKVLPGTSHLLTPGICVDTIKDVFQIDVTNQLGKMTFNETLSYSQLFRELTATTTTTTMTTASSTDSSVTSQDSSAEKAAALVEALCCTSPELDAKVSIEGIKKFHELLLRPSPDHDDDSECSDADVRADVRVDRRLWRDDLEIQRLVSSLKNASSGREFFVTEAGRYGIGLSVCEPGDAVVVVVGEGAAALCASGVGP